MFGLGRETESRRPPMGSLVSAMVLPEGLALVFHVNVHDWREGWMLARGFERSPEGSALIPLENLGRLA